jgi:hypothetical protein
MREEEPDLSSPKAAKMPHGLAIAQGSLVFLAAARIWDSEDFRKKRWGDGNALVQEGRARPRLRGGMNVASEATVPAKKYRP